ncbi:hypothetical protein AB0B10_26040 [Micromonospora arborensis]|uniref:hypothetical protein n=1 Tax=Micromonospora arborensis TaxID=2116518 RepID=UPI0033F646B2
MIGFVMFVAGGHPKVVRGQVAVGPEQMGVATLALLRERTLGELLDSVKALRELPEGMPRSAAEATAEERLRDVVGQRPAELAKAVLWSGIAEADPVAVTDSSLVTWGYVIDLDYLWLEVYRGQQTESHRDGRFIAWPRRDPNACPPRLVARIPLFVELPDDDAFLAAVAAGVTGGPADRYVIGGTRREDAHGQLDELRQLLRQRLDWRNQHETLPATMQSIVAVVENATQLLLEDAHAASVIGEIAKLGRKVRMTVELHVEGATLDAVGGRDVLRSSPAVTLVTPGMPAFHRAEAFHRIAEADTFGIWPPVLRPTRQGER